VSGQHNALKSRFTAGLERNPRVASKRKRKQMLMARMDTNEHIAIAGGADADWALTAQQRQLEEQLATIITSARSVAVAAEELLREVSHSGAVARAAPHAITMAPRLLAATEQQLLSVSAMLRQA
jgi:hypothetical protein